MQNVRANTSPISIIQLDNRGDPPGPNDAKLCTQSYSAELKLLQLMGKYISNCSTTVTVHYIPTCDELS